MSIRRAGVGRTTPRGLSGSYSSAVIADSPLVYWRLNETSGTTLLDSSGNSLSLTTSGTPTLNVTGPFPGAAGVTFNGSSQYASRAGSFTNSITAFSFELWLKTTDTSSQQWLLARDDINFAPNDSQRQLGVDTDSGQTTFNMTTGTSANAYVAASPGRIFKDGAWHQLVVTWSNATGVESMYFDGVLRDSYTLGGTLNSGSTTPFTLACVMLGGSPSRFYIGSLSEVSVYNTTLSPTRIAAHYAAAA